MLRMANVYKNSSEIISIGNILLRLLGKNQNVNVKGNPLNFDSVILPRIVLLAIDIEILFKAINLADNDNKPIGHNWVELYAGSIASFIGVCFIAIWLRSYL